MPYTPRSKTIIQQALTNEEQAELSRLDTLIANAQQARRKILARVRARLVSSRIKAGRMAAE